MKKWMEQRSYSCAVFLITVLWSGLFAVMGVDVHHDGIMMVTALDVADGAVLFRETFAQYGILTPLLQGTALRLFGRELIVIRLLTVLFYGGAAVMLDATWKRVLAWPFRLLMLGMFLFLAPYLVVTFHPWSSVYALFTMLVAAEFALRGTAENARHSAVWWFLTGVSAMVTFGFRQPCGEVTLLAGTIVLGLCAFCGRCSIREALARFGAMTGGAAVVAGCYALYLSLNGCWQDYLLQNFTFISRFAWQRGGSGDYSRLSNAFFPLATDDNTSHIIFGLLPLFSLGLFGWACRGALRDRRSLQKELPLLVLLTFALAGWHQYYPVPCVRHLYWGGVMMFGAFALVFQRAAALTDKKKKYLCIILLSLSLVPSLFIRGAGVVIRLPGVFTRQTINVPTLHGIKLAKGEHSLLSLLQDLCRQLPPPARARGILNCTDDAYYTILFPPTNFRHPMRQNWGDLVYQDYTTRRNDYVEKHCPLLFRKAPKGHSPEEREGWHGAYRTISVFYYMNELFVLEEPLLY